MCPSTPHFKWTATELARMLTSMHGPTVMGGQLVWVQSRTSKWNSQLGKIDQPEDMGRVSRGTAKIHVKEAPPAVTPEQSAGFGPCCPWGNWLQDTVHTSGSSQSCQIFLWGTTTISCEVKWKQILGHRWVDCAWVCTSLYYLPQCHLPFAE